MRLPRRGEIGLDADVQLLGADLEPDATAAPERLRLHYFLEPEQLTEEAARGVLAAGGGRQFNVVDAVDHRLRLARGSYAPGYS